MAKRPDQWRTVTRTDLDPAMYAELTSALDGIPNAVNRAARNAVNATIRKTGTRVRVGMVRYTTLSSDNIRRRMRVFRALQSGGDTWGTVLLQGRRFGVINFRHVDTRKVGVLVTMVRGGPVKRYSRAFVATGRSGNEHVFERVDADRLPIDAIRTKGLASLYQGSRVQQDVDAWMPGELRGQIRSHIDKILKRQK